MTVVIAQWLVRHVQVPLNPVPIAQSVNRPNSLSINGSGQCSMQTDRVGGELVERVVREANVVLGLLRR